MFIGHGNLKLKAWKPLQNVVILVLKQCRQGSLDPSGSPVCPLCWLQPQTVLFPWQPGSSSLTTSQLGKERSLLYSIFFLYIPFLSHKNPEIHSDMLGLSHMITPAFICQDYHNKVSQTGRFTWQIFTFHSSGGQMSKITVSAGLALSEDCEGKSIPCLSQSFP